MAKLSHSIFITLVTLYFVSGEDKEPKYKIKNKKLMTTFNKLLYAVTSVNEERLSALKTFIELQNYLPKVSRTGEKNSVVAVIIPNTEKYDTNNLYNMGPSVDPGDTPEILKAIKEKNYASTDDENLKIVLDESSEENETGLRQWKGCNKSAAKVCKKACIAAFKDVCSDYRCSRSMKKAGKRSCKSICNSKFRRD